MIGGAPVTRSTSEEIGASGAVSLARSLMEAQHAH